jgi:hypothetical protein
MENFMADHLVDTDAPQNSTVLPVHLRSVLSLEQPL